MPPLPKQVGTRNIFANDGTLIVGDEGMLLGAQLLPEAKAKAVGKPPQKLERSPGHYQEWIDACKGGKPAGSNFVDHAGLLAAVVLMGNIAIRTRREALLGRRQAAFQKLRSRQCAAPTTVSRRLGTLNPVYGRPAILAHR